MHAIDVWHLKNGEPLYGFHKENYIRGGGITPEQQRLYDFTDEMIADYERAVGVDRIDFDKPWGDEEIEYE